MKSPLRTLGCLLIATTLAVPPVDAAPAKGTLQASLTGPVQTLDPAVAADPPSRLCVAALYDALYEYDHLARPYELVPVLAAAPPVEAEDHLSWTVTLKEGVRYPNDLCFDGGQGRTVTASDVAFCLLRLMDAHTASQGRWVLRGYVEGLSAFTAASGNAAKNPRRAEYTEAEGYPPVTGIRAVDDHTLEIRLVKPYPELPWALATSFTSVYPPEAIAKYGADFAKHPVGTGAYRLGTYLPARSVVLNANPDYDLVRYPKTDDDASEARLPRNNMVVLTVMKDALAEWNRFTQGDLDVSLVPFELIPSLVEPGGQNLVPPFPARGVTLHRDPRLEIHYDAFNMTDPVIGQPAGEKGVALRRALHLVTDEGWVIRDVYRGAAEAVEGPLLAEFPESDPKFLHPWARRQNETQAEVVDVAKEILAEVGYGEDAEIPVLKKTVRDDRASRQIFAIQQRQAAAAGIRIEGVFVGWNEQLKSIREGTAQIWDISWLADWPAAQNFLQLFYGPSAPDPNACRYANPAFDDLYLAARLLPPGPERTDYFRELQDIVTQDCPWRFRFRRVQYTATHPWVHGYRHHEFVERWLKYCRVDAAERHRRKAETR